VTTAPGKFDSHTRAMREPKTPGPTTSRFRSSPNGPGASEVDAAATARDRDDAFSRDVFRAVCEGNARCARGDALEARITFEITRASFTNGLGARMEAHARE